MICLDSSLLFWQQVSIRFKWSLFYSVIIYYSFLLFQPVCPSFFILYFISLITTVCKSNILSLCLILWLQNLCWTHFLMTYIFSTDCMSNNFFSLIIYWINFFIDGKCYNDSQWSFFVLYNINSSWWLIPFLYHIYFLFLTTLFHIVLLKFHLQTSLSEIMSSIVSICFLPVQQVGKLYL